MKTQKPNITVRRKSELIKKFHAIISHEAQPQMIKDEVKASYGVISMRDMTVAQLTEICDKLQNNKPAFDKEMNTWRRRVMAVLGEYCRLLRKDENADYIKAIAVRSSGGAKSFNSMTKQQLRTVYNAFLDENKVIKASFEVSNEEKYSLAMQN